MGYLSEMGQIANCGRFSRSCRNRGLQLLWVFTLPFRVVGWTWSLAVALGVSMVRFAVELIAAAFGSPLCCSKWYRNWSPS
jgi:hypothetical protein